MRLVPILLALALAAAWPAGAQQAALRGPVAPKAEPAAAPLPPPPAPLAPPQDAARCRTNCASGYYFCLSTESAEDCSPSWMQCRSACEAPARRQVITTLPPRS